MSVEVKNLTKVYDKQNAVNNISFTAEKGHITGFLGPNGAGKSTTMKIITCYTPPTQGSVHVCSLDVETDPLEIRKKIGYLPEHNPLYLDMYVHEYLGVVAGLHGLKGKKAKERIQEMMLLCGLTYEQNKKIGQLSKGYRQRVGLAQALVHDPEVLILDEPTTGLDPNQLVEIRSLIKNISKDKTVILSTHIMQEVQALCDRVIIINKGELVANDDVLNITKEKRNEKRIYLTFSSLIDLALLENLEIISSIKLIKDSMYCVFGTPDKDIRNELILHCVAHKLPLVEIYDEEKTLEEVFRNVTQ
jgi:ABC-2 type transport system ATP-binding protein